MTQLLQQQQVPFAFKVVLACCIICGFAAIYTLVTMDRAPTTLEHTCIFFGLLFGIVSAIVAYSLRKTDDNTSAQQTTKA